MGKINFSLVVFLLAITGCNESKRAMDKMGNDLVTVDVMTTDYPMKELILQDFMDVEYIALETNDDFINEGLVQAVGQNILVVKNGNDDGDIFIYSRKTGEAIRKINHKGQGAEEYVSISRIVLDEDKDEMFVIDNSAKRMLIYDLEGKFKRSFKFPENTMYKKIFNFDKQNLICYNFSPSNQGTPFTIISKQDGSITQEIQIPFEEKKTITITLKDEAKDMIYGADFTIYPIIPLSNNNNWILVEPSSDTIYCYSSEHEMKPFLTRTPSIQSMDPEVFLFLNVVTDRYYFMGIVKKEYSFTTNKGFPSNYMMYDRQEQSMFRYTVYNNDYSNKKTVNIFSPENSEVAFYNRINPSELVDSYKKGELKGKLKEIAATLDEDSNPVIMVVKHKK
ncbi:MAG: BF3164 family lipoprotein [Bacteroidales bacterium]